MTELRELLEDNEALTLSPPADEATVAAFEARLGITLTSEHRQFVREVCDGLSIDGEAGLLSLAQISQQLDGADPTLPWAYSSAESAAIRAAIVTDGGVMTSKRVMAMQRRGRPHGALPLTLGDGNDVPVIVVTGEERGWVWRTGEVDVPYGQGFVAWLTEYAANMF